MPDKHKLKEIRVEGYKSIKQQTVPIGNMNVLIGQNGAGKSNFISLFEFLKDIIEARLQFIVQKAGGADQLLFYGSKETAKVHFRLDFGTNLYEIFLEPTTTDSLFVEKELCGSWREEGNNEHTPYWSVSTRDRSESDLHKIKRDGAQDYAYNFLKNWRLYHFHDTSDSAGMKKYASISDTQFLFEDASNLAAFLYLLQERYPDFYDRIVKTIQLVIPFFKNFVLRPNALNAQTIRMEWQDKFSDKIFTASSLSDGSLRFICMATLLLQPKLPPLIILDEPELGLHPTAISILAGLLKKASVRSQVLISTQSVNLVNEFEPENVIVVDREEGASVFRTLDSEKLAEWLNNYSLGDIWEKNVIGGMP
jgi:predicted ATPase